MKLHRTGLTTLALLAATAGCVRATTLHVRFSSPAAPHVAPPIPYDEIMPLRKIHSGMVGYGLTVFHGTRVEKFGVRVIDILKKAYMGHDLILIRMTGGPITQRGANIIAGMSGSPVYLGGKLAGAVSMGYQWPKEPVAMVTPIEFMEDALNPRLPSKPQFSSTPWSKQPLDFASTGFLGTRIEDGANTESTWARRFEQAASALGAPASAAPGAATDGDMIPRPLMTPLYTSGLSPQLAARLNRVVSPFGLQVATGLSSGSAPAAAAHASFQPGSMMGVFFCTGDVELGGYGTITYRKGNRILAFGHPLEMLGPIDFPLSTAYVADVFSSYSKSEKMCEPGDIVGSLRQDRPWSVLGAIGQPAHTVPLTVEVADDQTGKTKTFHVKCVDHPLWTGMVADVAAQEAVTEVRNYPGDSMANVRVEVDPAGMAPIVRTNTYFDYFDPNGMGLPALADMDRILDILQNNPFHAVGINGIKVSLRIHPGRKMSAIERIAVNKNIVAPGGVVHADVTLRPWKGEPHVVPMDVRVPADAPNGPASLLITGGMLSPLPAQPSAGGGMTIVFGSGGRSVSEPAGNLSEMIARFLKTDKNNDLVGRIVIASPSYNVGGERLYNLPPAISSAIHSPRSTGVMPLVDEAKTVRRMSDVMIGAQGVAINIQRREDAAAGPTEGAPSPAPGPPATPAATPPGENGGPSESDSDASAASIAPAAYWNTRSAADVASPEIVPPRGDRPATLVGPAKTTTTTEPAPAGGSTPSTPDQGTDTVAKKLQTWTLHSAAEFATGTGEGVSVGSSGNVSASRRFELMQALDRDDYVWAARTSPAAGGEVLFGTGDHGRVYRERNGKLELALQTPELDILALAFSPEGAPDAGAAYAGTAPNGEVYRLAPAGTAEPKPSPFFKTGKNYVLALAVDGKGTVYAGANGGAIYRITSDGHGAVWFQSSESHICALAVATNGDLLAGTSPSGLVYRITPEGRASVLWDSGDTSVSALAVLPGGDILVGTAPKGEISRIAGDGTGAVSIVNTGSPVHDIAVVGDRAYATAGTALYEIRSNREYVKIKNRDDQELLSVTGAPGGDLLVGSGALATVYRVGPSKEDGWYRTAVKDAGAVASWGHVRWEGEMPEGGGLTFETRTGNSSIPDASWSSWTPASPGADGSAIESPRGRYIQVRAIIKSAPGGKSAVMRSLSVTYLPENRPPTVTVSSPAAGVSLHGKIDLTWHGQDPDGDALLYQVAYSQDGGADWKPAALSTADGKAVDGAITGDSYKWDTSSLKDGVYLLRVTVSDRRSNPDKAMHAEALAGPFRVVNQQPSFALSSAAVRVGPDGAATFEGTVSGHGSPVVAVSYRIDGGAWFAADPTNGLFDSETVSFRVQTDPLPTGKHKIEVEAVTASGEKATSTFDVERPPAVV